MYGILENGSVIAKFVAPMSVYSNQPVFFADALSLKRKVAKRSAQRWEIETRLEPLSYSANDLFVSFVTRGLHTQLDIRVPQNIGVIESRTAVAGADGTGTAGDTSVTVGGNTGLIPAGTFLTFANHTKVYITTADITGNGSVGIYPALRVSVTNSPMKYLDDVDMKCYYDTDTRLGMSFVDGILMDNGTVKLVEAI